MTIARRTRRGTVLPTLGVCLIGLFGFVALAVDLGILAVSRTQCQNAADVGALVGARALNNKPGVSDSNRTQAIQDAKDVITGTGPTEPGNYLMSTTFAPAQITNVQAGVYVYNTGTFTFGADFVTPPGAGQSWTAMKVEIVTSQPTYFMRVFGVNTMPSGAYAIAVHRPRDIAFALDMTGSMGYSSQFNGSSVGASRSMNPDNLVPVFGHYVDEQPNIRATANLTNGNGEAFPRNNFTIATPGGPPIVRGFYFDGSNAATPANSVVNIATKTVAGVLTADLLPAFHRWSPPETGGDSNTYTPVTYNFAGYNAMHNGTEASPKGPTPAPGSFGSMTDAGAITYVGDRYRRADGGIDKTDTTWSTADVATKAATTAAELLGYTVDGSGNICKPDTTVIASAARFRDPVWETYGYDLDVKKYRTWRATYNNGNPALASEYLAHANGGNNVLADILVPTEDRFIGYSMGPGYWGKTMFIWPPDPRAAHDWRLKFLYRSGTTALNPQGDNNGGTAGTPGVNERIMDPDANDHTLASGSFSINYTAVLAWIKSGPQTCPPNLRAGHVRYYTSIPDNVTGAGNATEVERDKMFWREYIEYVFASGYTSGGNLYGVGDSWGQAPTAILTGTLTTWTGPTAAWTGGNVLKPYMAYSDSPNRPRLHFWFGPLSMMDFLQASGNMLAGTCAEAQCWQLKAGMNSVLDDIRNNHPNDAAGLVFFSANHHNSIRVPMGQNFIALKNALFYPRSLLSTLDVTTPTVASVRAEYRPYEDDFSAKSAAEIPNAGGSTDPNTGLMYAFNLLSPSASLPTNPYGSVKGRRGASKIVIFETDGVPNTARAVVFNQQGYNSYYAPGASTGNDGNNNSVALDDTFIVVSQIVKQMAGNVSDDSGLSLPNAKALVYSIGFGDLFDATLAPGATTSRDQAHAFLAKVGWLGGTGGNGPTAPTTLTPDQVITGPYATRISTLRSCMERIFQSGVSVTLIE